MMFTLPLDYALFMAEKEGHLDTRESCFNKMLKDLRSKHYEGVTHWVIDEDYTDKFGIAIESLTPTELRMCENALLKGVW